MSRTAFILSLVAVLLSAAPATALELCAAIDGSASLSRDEFGLQLEGLASSVEDPSIVPRDGSVTLSVVRFEWGAFLEIPATLINSQAAAEGVAALIRGLEWRFGHRTDLAAAIRECLGQFIDPSDEWIIDISTDGRQSQTLGTDPMEARDEAVLGGLDVLNALSVGDADMEFLGDLVWPQPRSLPPEKGFVLHVPVFSAYVQAMQEKIKHEVELTVPVDIKPSSCPNPIWVGSSGILPVAILGTGDLDVFRIDPETVSLEGVEPVSWAYEDVSTPFDPGAVKESCAACTDEGPDGYPDLTLKFDKESIYPILGDVEDGDCLLLSLTARLREEYGLRNLTGTDVLRILRKKR